MICPVCGGVGKFPEDPSPEALDTLDPHEELASCACGRLLHHWDGSWTFQVSGSVSLEKQMRRTGTLQRGIVVHGMGGPVEGAQTRPSQKLIKDMVKMALVDSVLGS